MPDVPMPAWMRRIQQSYYWQKMLLPTLVGFGGSLILQGCMQQGLENIQRACAVAAFHTTILTWVTAWIQGHSPGSSNFKSDGTPTAAPVLKQLDDKVLLVKQKAADPASPVSAGDAVVAEQVVKRAAEAVMSGNEAVNDALSKEGKP